jgi:hypothetical protein
MIFVAIVRQLAEAKRSPGAAIKNQYQRTLRVQKGKPLHRPGRIGQFEIRDVLPNLWSRAARHGSFDVLLAEKGTAWLCRGQKLWFLRIASAWGRRTGFLTDY